MILNVLLKPDALFGKFPILVIALKRIPTDTADYVGKCANRRHRATIVDIEHSRHMEVEIL